MSLLVWGVCLYIQAAERGAAGVLGGQGIVGRDPGVAVSWKALVGAWVFDPVWSERGSP